MNRVPVAGPWSSCATPTSIVGPTLRRREFLRGGLAAAVAIGASGEAHPAGATAAETQRWLKRGVIFPAGDRDRWDDNPSSPHVILVKDRLRMYYTGRRRFRMPDGRQEFELQIGAAEADPGDPLVFRSVSTESVICVGQPGTLDHRWAGYPWVVKVTDDHWHMYYVGWGGDYWPDAPQRKVWRTTLAESDDGGATWRKTGRIILPPGRAGGCDEHGSGSSSVIRVGDEFWMWYTAIYQPRSDFYRISIAVAVSRDGGHAFEQHPAGAVMSIPPLVGLPGSTCSKPCVRFDDGKFKMWFSCAKDGEHYRVHYAESSDGLNFRWHPDPVVDVSPDGWDSAMTCYPSVVNSDDRTLMYYSGNGYVGIGAAEFVAATKPGP